MKKMEDSLEKNLKSKYPKVFVKVRESEKEMNNATLEDNEDLSIIPSMTEDDEESEAEVSIQRTSSKKVPNGGPNSNKLFDADDASPIPLIQEEDTLVMNGDVDEETHSSSINGKKEPEKISDAKKVDKKVTNKKKPSTDKDKDTPESEEETEKPKKGKNKKESKNEEKTLDVSENEEETEKPKVDKKGKNNKKESKNEEKTADLSENEEETEKPKKGKNKKESKNEEKTADVSENEE